MAGAATEAKPFSEAEKPPAQITALAQLPQQSQRPLDAVRTLRECNGRLNVARSFNVEALWAAVLSADLGALNVALRSLKPC